jgi:DNA-binding response OmpR family regulator
LSKKILLIDDDALMRRSLAFNLERAGYHVRTEGSAEDGLAAARLDAPDVVLLDIGLPGMDGLDAVRIFHAQMDSPVIFLTARHRELDEVLGLELGADDYITKPFDLDVLLTRIKVVLRRAHPQQEFVPAGPLAVGDLVIDAGAHTLRVHGRDVDLSPKEFDLLYALTLHANSLVTTEELLTQVWGAEYAGQPQVVYVHIRWLREKIETDPNHPRRIVTIRGLGYKFVSQEA